MTLSLQDLRKAVRSADVLDGSFRTQELGLDLGELNRMGLVELVGSRPVLTPRGMRVRRAAMWGSPEADQALEAELRQTRH
jgi:hypothetical protein